MAKKKGRKAKTRAKSEEIITEERETRVYPTRKKVLVRTEPPTLSEALGEPVATGPVHVRGAVRTRRVA
jgi:hypothetical protein